MSSARLSRREVLGLGIAAGVPAAVGWAAENPSPPAEPHPKDQPRNIIFMVADGMSAGVPSMAEPFSRLVRGTGTWFYRLLQHPETSHGLFEMQSLNSLVTDSSAASSSWASGSRVFNGAVNVLPDGTRLTPVAPLMRSARRRVGLVTTTQVAHATPAGFAAVQPDRDDMHLIAPQYLDLVDVILGGGREHFDARYRKDKEDWLARFSAKGYAVVGNRDELLATRSDGRLLGVFGTGHLPYSIDQRNSPEITRDVPTLADMTRVALSALVSQGDGFLLQVEGGRVDHAAHANDAAAILWEQLAFDDAIGVVMEFAGERSDTLVVITSDHGNANPGLNGMGSSYKSSNECFEKLAGATASFTEIRKRLKAAAGDDNPGEDAVIDVVRQATAIELTRREAGAVAAAMKNAYKDELNEQHANFVGALGQALGNHNGVGWTGISHTADLVLSMAVGTGREMFRGLMRNVDAFSRITHSAGVTFENPRMSPEQARKLADTTRSRSAVRHVRVA